MKRLVKDIFTESDGKTFDPMPMLAVVATAFVLVIIGHSYFVRDSKFSITDFGIGVGAIWAASAGGSRMRPQAGYRNYESTGYRPPYSDARGRGSSLEDPE